MPGYRASLAVRPARVSLPHQMVSVGGLQLHVLEAVLADVEFGLLHVFLRVGREVPRVNLVPADLGRCRSVRYTDRGGGGEGRSNGQSDILLLYIKLRAGIQINYTSSRRRDV